MWEYKRPIRSDELYHHGILGMHWGKRNGPPYPLDASDHSASEKKAGWKKSLDSGSATSAKDRYKQAKKAYNKSFSKAYYRSGLHITKKGRDADKKRWEDAYDKAKALDKAKKAYKKEKFVKKYGEEAYSAREQYKKAKKAYNKAYLKADTRRGIHLSKEARDADAKRWADAIDKGMKAGRAQKKYKKLKKKGKAYMQYLKNQ